MNRTRSALAGLRSFAVLALCCLVLVGCSRHDSRELQPGIYRATLELPGGKVVPFGLDVAREESGTVFYLVNGPERVRVPEVETAPGKFTARMPGYENTLSGTVSGEELEGELALVHGDDRVLRLPFTARLGETWRFYPELLADNADMAGRWEVSYVNDAGRRASGVAVFDQRFAQVTGTVMLPASDQRYLAGEVYDEALRLSRFDGGAVLLYEAKLNASGELVGDFWSDRGGHQRFVARRNPDAGLDASAIATRLLDPEAGFEFSFKDPDGQVVSSRDPRFAGKVLLVTLAGSWCPNSHDETAVLATLSRKYRARGLEVVTLMFEQHGDFTRAAAAVQRFRANYRIEYPTPIAGRMDRRAASQALPQLDAVHAYPTAIFIDRTGRVRKIHTGFAGPATGVEHELLVHEFEQVILQLLAEGEAESTPAAAQATQAATAEGSAVTLSPGS
jgi:thiol-disulfide isomerase/thioredoxin